MMQYITIAATFALSLFTTNASRQQFKTSASQYSGKPGPKGEPMKAAKIHPVGRLSEEEENRYKFHLQPHVSGPSSQKFYRYSWLKSAARDGK